MERIEFKYAVLGTYVSHKRIGEGKVVGFTDNGVTIHWFQVGASETYTEKRLEQTDIEFYGN